VWSGKLNWWVRWRKL